MTLARTCHVDQEKKRDPSLRTKLDEVGRLQCRGTKQNPIIRDDPDVVPMDVRETSQDGCPVLLLELSEAATIHEAGDDVTHIKCLSDIRSNDAMHLSSGV